jgi:hypothetical protein
VSSGRGLPRQSFNIVLKGQTSAASMLVAPGGKHVHDRQKVQACGEGSAEKVARRVRESFVPLLRELPGFREYYLLEGGPDALVSIRAFDSADEALASKEIAANWMRDNVREYVKGMPEVMAGNVLVAEGKDDPE